MSTEVLFACLFLISSFSAPISPYQSTLSYLPVTSRSSLSLCPLILPLIQNT